MRLITSLSGDASEGFAVIDTFSREGLASDLAHSFPPRKVTNVLDRVIDDQGKQEVITLDNGTEFITNHFNAWAHESGRDSDLIRPGRPVEYGCVASSNGKLRDGCPKTPRFWSVEEARQRIEEWRFAYNEARPHSSLGDFSPGEARKQNNDHACDPGPGTTSRSSCRTLRDAVRTTSNRSSWHPVQDQRVAPGVPSEGSIVVSAP